MRFDPVKVPPAGSTRTPREMAMEARISELEAELHLRRARDNQEGPSRLLLEDEHCSVFDPQVIRLAIPPVRDFRVIADWRIDRVSPFGGYHVIGRTSRTRDDPATGFSYAVTHEHLYSAKDRTRLLVCLHERVIQELYKE